MTRAWMVGWCQSRGATPHRLVVSKRGGCGIAFIPVPRRYPQHKAQQRFRRFGMVNAKPCLPVGENQ